MVPHGERLAPHALPLPLSFPIPPERDTRDRDVGHSAGVGFCVLGEGCFGVWVLGFGFWVWGFGFWVLGFGLWV